MVYLKPTLEGIAAAYSQTRIDDAASLEFPTVKLKSQCHKDATYEDDGARQ